MSPEVRIIDYGMGNIMSVSRAFEHFGANVTLTNSPGLIAGADYLVLPGVGAFGDGMANLNKGGIAESVKEFVGRERPFLGICLGMQMMLDKSDEFGSHVGLRLVAGSVVAIPQKGIDGTPHKIPHIGWNKLLVPDHGKNWSNTILDGVREGEYAYFVHSFTAIPADDASRLADCLYGGCLMSAAIRSGSLYGCQFHPEKSGGIGLQIIENFLKE